MDTPMNVSVALDGAQHTLQKIADNLSTVIKGQQASVRLLLAAIAAGQHVLLEDFPGTGKTTLAKALARSIQCDFQRIQFTPDLLPSDIVGVSIYSQSDQRFHFHQGPLFTHILLADEINRASPRTQSALLEAMAEGQVSIDGTRHVLDDIFFVIATQNPVESHGTYPLPEAQMDRFGLKFSLGYVPRAQEVEIVNQQNVRHPLDDLDACVSRSDIVELRSAVAETLISDELVGFIVDIVAATRGASGVKVGAGSRASLALKKMAQALALFDRSGFVEPDHIVELAVPTIAHRLVLDPQARFSGRTAPVVVEEILHSMPVPA